jgi:hypothetical protein
MSSDANSERIREKIEATLAQMATAAKNFATRLRAEAGIEIGEMIDPEGEAVASLVDAEGSAGAASLAQPIDLITFETWMLGQIGDREELDLDVNTHHDLWLGLGAWVAETVRERHGAFWLIGGEDPRAWRMGFSKILLEVQPHVFAERLLRSGQGLAKRLIAEVERIRVQHESADAAEGGKAKDKYQPQHYARLHSVPLAQWMVFDLGRLHQAWQQMPVAELVKVIAESGKRLPPQNAPVVEQVVGVFSKLDQAQPAVGQVNDRHLFEAVAQITSMRRVTGPIAVDVLEKLVLPALHMGAPDKFPPLGEDDVEQVQKGNDLFAVMVDVVPFAHQAEEGGFLGTFAPTDLGTPYPDRNDLQIGKGDWVMVNPARLKPLLDGFDPRKLLASYEAFVTYLHAQPGVPRVKDIPRGLAETSARALAELKACVVAAAPQGSALVFRLLPPPQ